MRASLTAVVLSVVGIVAGHGVVRATWQGGSAAPHVITDYPGNQGSPALSSDGSRIAFTWNGEQWTNTDIYVKPTDSTAPPRRLTTDPAPDIAPAWSPDGTQIAFIRRPAGPSASLYVIPAGGGAERKVTDLTLASANGRTTITWSPDGRGAFVAASVAGEMNGIFLIPITGGERQTLLSGGLSEGMFVFPSVSPRGDSLAYALCRGIFCDAYALSLGVGHVSQGSPRRLTTAHVNLFGIAWTSDGQSIVYGSVAGGGQALWRTAIADGRAERLPSNSAVASFPTIARRSGALAYVSGSLGSVWKIEAAAPPKVLASGYDAYLSPDGQRIAFVSMRPDGYAVWAASADGTKPTRLTTPIPGKQVGSPRWSPDGRQIAFDAQSDDGDGVYHVFLIDAAGGQPRRLTNSTFAENLPTWSRDGKSIYFRSNRTGKLEVFRISVSGGEALQVTQNGGSGAWESVDGKTLYYANNADGTGGPLMAKPLDGGPERQIADSVWSWALYPVAKGVYYIARPDPEHPYSFELRFAETATGQTSTVTRFQSRGGQGLSASADGKTILFSGSKPSEGTHLMLLRSLPRKATLE